MSFQHHAEKTAVFLLGGLFFRKGVLPVYGTDE
jgi:hypothetical protein